MSKQLVNWDYQWGQIVGRAWADDDFSQRLLSDPVSVLREYDLHAPAGFRVEVLADPDRVPEVTDGVMHLLLPGKPSAAELSEEEMCSGGGCRGRRSLWLRRMRMWRLSGLLSLCVVLLAERTGSLAAHR